MWKWKTLFVGWSTASCKFHSSSVILLSPCEIYASSSLKLYTTVYNIFKAVFFSFRNPLTTATNLSPRHFLGKWLLGCNFVRFRSHDPPVSWRWARTIKFSIRKNCLSLGNNRTLHLSPVSSMLGHRIFFSSYAFNSWSNFPLAAYSAGENSLYFIFSLCTSMHTLHHLASPLPTSWHSPRNKLPFSKDPWSHRISLLTSWGP